jgi:hypothetical protein
VPPGDDVGRDGIVVEGEQRLLVDDQVAPPGPLLQLRGVGEQGAVGVEERVLRVPVALDQGVADEQLAGDLGSIRP